jgi:hypothetical protein
MKTIKNKYGIIATGILWIILVVVPLICAMITKSWILVVFLPAFSIFGLSIATYKVLNENYKE